MCYYILVIMIFCFIFAFVYLLIVFYHYVFIMLVILFLILSFGIIYMLVFIYLEISYNDYVYELCNEYSMEEIDCMITDDLYLLDVGNFRGEMLESVIGHLEFWIKVKELKVRNDESNIS